MGKKIIGGFLKKVKFSGGFSEIFPLGSHVIEFYVVILFTILTFLFSYLFSYVSSFHICAIYVLICLIRPTIKWDINLPYSILINLGLVRFVECESGGLSRVGMFVSIWCGSGRFSWVRLGIVQFSQVGLARQTYKDEISQITFVFMLMFMFILLVGLILFMILNVLIYM